MKIKNKIIPIIVTIIILTPLISWLLWYKTPETKLRILILDKTVPMPERQEHRSLNWVLTNRMYTKTNKKIYSINDDYFGFFPMKPYKEEEYEIHDFEDLNETELKEICDTLDMIYFTDTYGVYYNEWYLDSLQTEHSARIYGGTTANEMILLEEMKKQEKLIITEFNTIASPTSRSIRRRFEKDFNIEWSSWTARHFRNLDTTQNKEIPRWVIRLYMEQHDNKWPFKKSGILFVHENTTLEILEEGIHLEENVPFIETNEYFCEKYGLIDKVHYPFWFDITFTNDSNEVISNYHLYPTELGDSILKAHHIPTVFPAAIQHLSDYRFYYFAGDFADNPLPVGSSFFRGVQLIDFLFYEANDEARSKFFWKYYLPLMTTILETNFKNK